MESLVDPTPDPAWVLTTEGFDALREAIYESRFSISNGFLGLRVGRAVSVVSAGSFLTELTSLVCLTYRAPSNRYLPLFRRRAGSRSAFCFLMGH